MQGPPQGTGTRQPLDDKRLGAHCGQFIRSGVLGHDHRPKECQSQRVLRRLRVPPTSWRPDVPADEESARMAESQCSVTVSRYCATALTKRAGAFPGGASSAWMKRFDSTSLRQIVSCCRMTSCAACRTWKMTKLASEPPCNVAARSSSALSSGVIRATRRSERFVLSRTVATPGMCAGGCYKSIKFL